MLQSPHILGLAFEQAYDIAIIVSGDGDYETAIQFIKNKGVKAWAVTFRSALSTDLKRIADKVILPDNYADKTILEDISKWLNRKRDIVSVYGK
ncbi:MAG TPA: NYN domain-containing protein [Candidatus Diapherotrites archaeon]|uniref:NYN domain-containing protein n=1 Tax=Candidatus Iainarchaeum sp. TaxID=3101447 RepID=A0A7J4IXY7_9ARCH|nr:NYN domain-containing protein [Candidatus Diapherotrites archaeon]